MRMWLFCFLFLTTTSWANIGRVLKLVGDTDAYLVRSKSKINLSPGMPIELGDEIISENTYLVIHLYPGTQMSLGKNTQATLSEHLIKKSKGSVKAFSVMDFVKGMVRIQVSKDSDQEINLKVQAKDVAFSVRETEFEVSLEENQDVDLDVFEGEVEVTSPHVHTFVPEIVKANEGFRFEAKQKNFSRRRFSPKFRNHPGFLDAGKLRREWRELTMGKNSKKKAKGSKLNAKSNKSLKK